MLPRLIFCFFSFLVGLVFCWTLTKMNECFLGVLNFVGLIGILHCLFVVLHISVCWNHLFPFRDGMLYLLFSIRRICIVLDRSHRFHILICNNSYSFWSMFLSFRLFFLVQCCFVLVVQFALVEMWWIVVDLVFSLWCVMNSCLLLSRLSWIAFVNWSILIVFCYWMLMLVSC